jgi:hypothetical protein
MRRTTVILLLAALAAVALLPAAAGAKKRRSRFLWATVNVCDTKRHPDRMGVRARMPGNGRKRQRMYMRFSAQFHSSSGWRRVKHARSPWYRVGSARANWKESGHNFDFTAPPAGTSYEMRGYVQYQWRAKRKHHRGWRVVKRRQRLTRGGHPGTVEADPKGFSAAHCKISTPPE